MTAIARGSDGGSRVLLTRRCNERVCVPNGYTAQCIGVVVAGVGSAMYLAGRYDFMYLYLCICLTGTISSSKTSCDCH